MPASFAEPLALSLRDVVVDHPVGGGVVRALDGVDLDVGAGERVALLGSSGAGKSTLLDVVAGLVRPTSGDVEVLGRRIAELGGGALRRHRSEVGVIRQAHGLPGALRVVHNVNGGRLGAWSTVRALASLIVPMGRSDVDEALGRVGLDGLADRRTGDLSGGQQQRVAVARVLVQNPELVLADEPVSAVDPRLSADVVELLCSTTEREPRRDAVLLSLHDPTLARDHVDRIVGLREGRVAFDLAAQAVDSGMLTSLYAPA
ncbi:phosphonate ABC transporter ATP-binding protein [Ilumatobacter nonamiensis]|uniref:phosphonate ABC transporter ATP-binding protein n=1 Tax=Ilumatobacter nonamiensis TaxID=467093 RepID=UPI0009FE78F6|nr:ATP-binding cassette domain-containing protein [Ilumatobacter nonamiensis]